MFKEKLKEILDKKGLKNSQLSEMTGIPQTTISQWLNKGSLPAIDKFEKLLIVLDVSPYYFLDIEPKNESHSHEQDNIILKYNKLNSAAQKELDNYLDYLLNKDENLEGHADAESSTSKIG